MSKLNVASIVDAFEIQFNIPLKDWDEPELLKFYAANAEKLGINKKQQAKTIEVTKKEIEQREATRKRTAQLISKAHMQKVVVIDSRHNAHYFDSQGAAAKFIGCSRSSIGKLKRKPQDEQFMFGYRIRFEEKGGIDHG